MRTGFHGVIKYADKNLTFFSRSGSLTSSKPKGKLREGEKIRCGAKERPVVRQLLSHYASGLAQVKTAIRACHLLEEEEFSL